jgi:C-terminal processing protease CtpA/Prc
VPFLVIDLRDNEGGDDSIGHTLLRQLIRQPYEVPGGPRESAYERVPYNLVRYLDTWDYGFFDRTGQVTRGPGRNFLLSPTPALPLAPVAQPYAGRSIMLVGPQNSSAGYQLARDTKASGAALLLGRTTGGNLRGLNGGQLTWMTLPASGVAVDIPLLAHYSKSPQPDAGVTPDVVVEPRFDDVCAGVDTEMRAARNLIDTWRRSVR